MRLEPINGEELKTLCNSGALNFVGDKVESFPVPDLIEAKLVRKAVRHAIFPRSRPARSVFLSPLNKRSNSVVL